MSVATMAAPPDIHSDGPGKTAQVVLWDQGAARQQAMRWGLKPFEPGGRSYNLLRAEGRRIERPCLIIANHFFVAPDDSKKRYRVNLITSEPFFCFAGLWQPAAEGWPASFAALTVPSSPDIAPLKDRHMAVVRPEDWQDWLRGARPPEETLHPFPRGSFNIVAPGGRAGGQSGELFDF